MRQSRTGQLTGPPAVATAAAFAGGALLTQIVVVPQWRAMAPAEFLHQFRTYGPLTGATVFPFEAAAIVLLVAATFSAFRAHRASRLGWLAAASAMVGTLVPTAVYFVGANLAMLDPAFPTHAVAGELTAWYAWDWVRAGLALAAAVLSCISLGTDTRTP